MPSRPPDKTFWFGAGNYVYDWLVTHHDKVLATLDFGFTNRLFREGYILPENGNYLIEGSTGLSFYPHDFRGLPEKDRALIDSQIEGVRTKYVRRAERTMEVLGSGGRVCVVRHFFAEPLDKLQHQQREIVGRLTELYPSTQFSYLWGSELDASGLNSPFGRVHHFPKALIWQGDDSAWNQITKNTIQFNG